MIQAAVGGLLEAFATAFHYPWYTVIPFIVLSLIRESQSSLPAG
jgi:hypothetical protein